MGSNRAIVLAAVAPRGVPIAAVQPEKRLREGARRLRRGRLRRWEANAEVGATALAVRDLDRALMAIDDPFRDREPEPRATRRCAAGAPEPLEQMGHVLGADPRPSSSTSRNALPPSCRTATRTWPPLGLWRMALSTRMKTSWRSRAASPSTIAGSGSTSTLTSFAPAGLTSDEAAAAATSPRSSGSRSREIAPESDRARRRRSSTSDVRCSTSAPISSSALPTELTGSSACRRRWSSGAPDDGQRRPQLVARVGGELALTAEREALRCERIADRDESAAGVDRPEADRDEDDHGPAEQQDARGSRRAYRCSVVRS